MVKITTITKVLLLLTPLLWRGVLGEAFSQTNIVPNYSFETNTQCPFIGNTVYYASPWFQPCIHFGNTTNSSSSDFFDTCTGTTGLGVPTNYFGFQQARNGGHGYVGIYLYTDTLNYREYLEVPLTDTLIANKKYCVEFYVSLSYPASAVSNCGAYFSIDSLLDTTNLKAIDYVTPQIENPIGNMLNDTANWMLISGNFIAQGGERFMTIGNFHNPANTNVQSLGGGTVAYYYVDDVSVVYCDPDGVEEETNENGVSIFPNPARSELGITNYEVGMQEVKVINVMGEEVISHWSLVNSNSVTLDVSGLEKGMYFVEVYFDKLSNRGAVRKKFVKE